MPSANRGLSQCMRQINQFFKAGVAARTLELDNRRIFHDSFYRHINGQLKSVQANIFGGLLINLLIQAH